MRSMRLAMTWWALIVAGIAWPLYADEKQKEEKPDYPKFEDVTKDMDVRTGFFTLYYDKDKDKLLAAVPKAMLTKHFLLASTVSGGPAFTGFQWDDGVVYWDRLDKQLVLMAADPRYRKPKGGAVEDVVQRTYTDAIVQSVKVVTETKQGDPVIDLADLFKGDFAGLARVYGRRVDSGLSRWSQVKAFESNVELAVDVALMGDSGDGIQARVHYSLSRLPEKDNYSPREADNRIGYFLTAIKDWSAPHDAKTVFKRYVNRWHLEKADPKADVSDVKPETQITFYLEKTIPPQFRPYVREGVLEWNKAFEKAGLRNAIQVIQQTDTVHVEKDAADVRYNFIRWIVSGEAFAMGPSRVNPFTGQILDADIIIDDSMLRAWIQYDYGVFGPKAILPFTDYQFEALWERSLTSPECFAHGLDEIAHAASSVDRVAFGLQRPEGPMEPHRFLREHFGHSCEHARGAVRQLAMASALAQAEGLDDLPEEFIGQALKETVMHEVGHTLGLRHNFKASAWKPLDEIRASRSKDEPTVGSVMDYNPYNFAAVKDGQGVFATPTLGPYDYWAIAYGYQQPGSAFKNEEEMLKAITSRVAEPGLDYATDEDTGMLEPDPLAIPWDNGDDPVAFARLQVETYQRLLAESPDWAVKDGENYSRLRRVVGMLLNHYAYGIYVSGRTVGGMYVHRDHKGDPNARPPLVPVPAEKQREAVRFMTGTVLSPSAFAFEPDLLNHLGPGRWQHWQSDDFDASQEFRIHDRVRRLGAMAFSVMLNPITLTRLHDGQVMACPQDDVFTVPELLTALTDAVWAELKEPGGAGPWTDRRPRIPSFRRDLQREYVEQMIGMALHSPGALYPADCVAVARMTVEDMGSRVSGVLEAEGSQLDAYTRAHLEACKQRIDKALAAKYVLP